jgi:hypothetical protein
MKANELRIGNLLLDRGDKVLKLDYWDFMKPAQRMFIGDSEVHPLTEDLEYCKPIPITEKWLLEAEFVSNPYQDRYEKGPIHIECDKTKRETYLWIENMPHIKYVHQLQNLYFALTGEELTYGDKK